MIIDMRVYRYAPSQFAAFLQKYDDVGYAITSRHLGTTVGVFTSHSGVQNRTLQLFAYRDADHRDLCRSRLRADPDWLAFIRDAGTHIVEQSNIILKPTDFSALCHFEELDDRSWLSAESPAESVFELITFGAHPGKLSAVLAALERQGRALIDEFATRPPLFLTTETGNGNRVLALIAFRSDAERHRQRDNMASDPRWQALRDQIDPLCAYQESDLWLARPYSPLR